MLRLPKTPEHQAECDERERNFRFQQYDRQSQFEDEQHAREKEFYRRNPEIPSPWEIAEAEKRKVQDAEHQQKMWDDSPMGQFLFCLRVARNFALLFGAVWLVGVLLNGR